MRISNKDSFNKVDTVSWPKKEAEKDDNQEQVKVSEIQGSNVSDVNSVNVSISTEGIEMYQKQLEAANESKDEFEDQAKMMEIARRIASGGKVPPEDEKKLMEFSAELYQMAKAAALLNENEGHKNYDTLFEEDTDEMSNKLSNLDSDVSESVETESIQSTESVDNEVY